jgi:hypothetical protein
MIYDIAKELAIALRAQNVPFPVVFGPEPTESTVSAKERVVIEQPIDEKRDSVEGPKATHPNPRMPLIRYQGCRVRIFARANMAGAAWHDHAERAEQVLDHVLAELDFIVRGRRNTMNIGPGGFVSLRDERGTLVWNGAVYEFDLTIDRGVFRTNWAGDAREEVVIGTDVFIDNTVKVSNAAPPAGTPPAGAEIASGGP